MCGAQVVPFECWCTLCQNDVTLAYLPPSSVALVKVNVKVLLAKMGGSILRYERAVKVGPSAYPHLTGQKECPDRLSIEDLERGRHCFEDDYEIIPNMVFKQEGGGLSLKGCIHAT